MDPTTDWLEPWRKGESLVLSKTIPLLREGRRRASNEMEASIDRRVSSPCGFGTRDGWRCYGPRGRDRDPPPWGTRGRRRGRDHGRTSNPVSGRGRNTKGGNRPPTTPGVGRGREDRSSFIDDGRRDDEARARPFLRALVRARDPLVQDLRFEWNAMRWSTPEESLRGRK